MNLTHYTEQFWRDGYLLIEDFFSEELMQLYQQKIIAHFGMAPEFYHNQEFLEKSQTEVIPWFPQREGEACFDRVSQNPDLSALSQAILGPGWYQQYSMVMFSKQGTQGQAWHQDCPPDEPAKFNLNRLIYTMDIDQHNTGGQVVVIPGSHRQGLLPSIAADFDQSQAVTLNPKKASLVLLHGHCFHKVTPITGQYRVSTNYRAAPQGTPQGITDIAVYRNMLYRFSTETVVEERGL